jgi:hypothetical protein
MLTQQAVVQTLASHAILNATATARVFKFSGRNPEIITRWPSHRTKTRQTRPATSKEQAAKVKPHAKRIPYAVR